jgi:hypothetical protein
MCPYYLKHAYCKHLMHAHAHTHQEGPLELQQSDKVFCNAVCARYTRAIPAERTASLHSGLSKKHQYHRWVRGCL